MTERQPGRTGVILIALWTLALLGYVVLLLLGQRKDGRHVAITGGVVLASVAFQYLHKRWPAHSGWRAMIRTEDIDIAMASAVLLLSVLLVIAPFVPLLIS